MSRRRASGVAGSLAAALTVLLLAPGRARACISEGAGIALATGFLLAPSEIGTLVTSDGPRFTLGWSGQYPFPDHERHRFIFGVNWVPGGPHAVEGRFGYRYAPGRVFGGLGLALDGHGTFGQGAAWSPELGVNLVPRHWESESFKVHLLVRGELAPAFDQVRGVGVLLGWTIF